MVPVLVIAKITAVQNFGKQTTYYMIFSNVFMTGFYFFTYITLPLLVVTLFFLMEAEPKFESKSLRLMQIFVMIQILLFTA